ncbi:MAG: cystathionine beta-lyase [Ancalomicrobiaceae bacterium]|nr:cystathionine beta-lyase [Ancalomicrobiaceae bacterium]
MAESVGDGKAHSIDTELVHSGRLGGDHAPFVNPPVVHASTVLFESVEQLHSKKARYVYGRRGTPTSDALASAISDLEGAEGTVITPSGLSAIAVALMAIVKAGDHLLVADNVYGPGRDICDRVLRRFGVDSTFYDPRIGAGIEALIRPNTSAVYLESPGSHTFEVADLPAIAEVAHRHGALVAVDNTWATGFFHKPLALGADLSILAATKYVVGHSDALVGTVSASGEALRKLRATHGDLGMWTGPDDMYLALRGLRTLAVRLRQHQESALRIARWLESRAEVSRVLYPALPTHPDYALWRRDFTGASGLMGVVLHPATPESVAALIDSLRLFAIGFSWGGFESLIVPTEIAHARSANPWQPEGPVIRLQIGLESPDDLIADLLAGFELLVPCEPPRAGIK